MNKKFFSAAIAGLLLMCAGTGHAQQQQYQRSALASPTLPNPISVYDNWSAYDELSDHVPLTQALSMRELDNVIRLKKAGARFDYYVMDAFWFDPNGGYRTWKKPNWPNGPWLWIKTCEENGIRPGLWFSTNTLVHLKAAPQWRDSLNKQGTAMSMFGGGFLPDFMNTLQFWYDHGIRMFLFDFADMTAATPREAATMTKQEIIEHNSDALRHALVAFRRKTPGVVLEAFNGFGGVMDTTTYPFPFKTPVDLRWLKAFDAIYCGDPRPSDVPEMSFWRSEDIYSDHQARRFQEAGIPLNRIDTTSFMPGKTGTNYRREFQAWKGSLILMLARGGWINTTYGNLELMSNADMHWYARVQSLYLHFQSEGKIHAFGGILGDVQSYGFGAIDSDGSVYVVVNPAQTMAQVRMPLLSPFQPQLAHGRLLFRDAGFTPRITGNTVELGPGQMVMVGFGKYASATYDFGVQKDVVIPRSIRPIAASFRSIGKGEIQAIIPAPANGDLRLIMQQYDPNGNLLRTWPSAGIKMDRIFMLKAEQDGKQLPIKENYNREVWSGLSWAVGEIDASHLHPGQPLTLTFLSTNKSPVTLTGHVYLVKY